VRPARVRYHRRVKLSRRTLGAAALGLTALASVAFFVLGGRGVSTAEIMAVRPDDVTIGGAAAPITVVVYYAFTCADCAEFHRATLPGVRARWIDTGRVRLVYRDLPQSDLDLEISTLSRCLGGLQKDRYLTWLNLLFHRQSQWAFAREPLAVLQAYATETDFAGFDRFQVCQGNPATESVVLEAAERARGFGVRAVPALFVNGRRAGAGNLDQLLAELAR